MENFDLSNIQTLVTLIITIVTSMVGLGKFLSKVLENKLNDKLAGLYHDNRRQYRYIIVDFAGDLHNKIKKTRDEFTTIFDIFNRYERLTSQLQVKNHQVDVEMDFIKRKYAELDENKQKEEKVS